MALYKNYPVSDVHININDSQGGTPAGHTSAVLPSPIRGRLMRVGASFESSVSSAATLAVTVWNSDGSTAALAATALGTAQIPYGKAAEIDIPSPIFVEQGDGLEFVFSGGPTSAASATAFAVIRP